MKSILTSFFSQDPHMTSRMLQFALLVLSFVMVTDSAVSDSVIYNSKSILEPDVPLLFPNDSNRYNIITNDSSLLEKFLYHSINMSNPEVIDMLNIQELKDNSKMSEIDRILKDPVDRRLDKKEQVKTSTFTDFTNLKSDSELLQEKGADVEKDSLVIHKEHLKKGAGISGSSSDIGRWIAMCIAILLTASATVYISILLWKKSLDRRYGSRQILVEDEEAQSEEYKHSMV